MENTKKKNWDNSRYGPPIRLTRENHTWINQNKGKRSMAGFLDFVIDSFKKNDKKRILGGNFRETMSKEHIEKEIIG